MMHGDDIEDHYNSPGFSIIQAEYMFGITIVSQASAHALRFMGSM